MDDKRQWLIGQILHLSAQLSQHPNPEVKQQLQCALAAYTQALQDLNNAAQTPPYFS